MSKKSSHLSDILALTARRAEKLFKDRGRGLHIHIMHKLIHWLGTDIGFVVGIHHPSVIKKLRGDIGTNAGGKPLFCDKIDKCLELG